MAVASRPGAAAADVEPRTFELAAGAFEEDDPLGPDASLDQPIDEGLNDLRTRRQIPAAETAELDTHHVGGPEEAPNGGGGGFGAGGARQDRLHRRPDPSTVEPALLIGIEGGQTHNSRIPLRRGRNRRRRSRGAHNEGTSSQGCQLATAESSSGHQRSSVKT